MRDSLHGVCTAHTSGSKPVGVVFNVMDVAAMQVANTLGDRVKILKIDTDENPEISSQLQVGASIGQI